MKMKENKEGGLYLDGFTKQSYVKKPLISVLIVVYNGAKYLEDALKSVFNQTYKNIELIVIDGNSTDGTQDILKEYNNQIDYWLSEPDSGQSSAFNKGFTLCNGDLLTWLNSDELYTPDAIEKVVNTYNKNERCSWLTAGLVFTDKDLNILKMRKGEGGSGLLKNLGVLNVYGSSTFFTKDLFSRAGGMNEELHFTMDTDLWWRFSKMGMRFCRVNSYLCLYRLHEESKTANYVVTGGKRKPEHQFEIDRLVNEYGKRWQSNFQFFLVKMIRNSLRLISVQYMFSLIDSVRFKGKSALKVFKIK
jgi:glycosyltransferase involved in cell wall biosynthesis